MANIQMTIASERWLDEVVLVGSVTDSNGDLADQYLLPAGLGDVAIMWAEMTGAAIATRATVTNMSLLMRVVSVDGSTTVDIVGYGEWRTAGLTNATVTVDPDALVLWRQGERLAVFSDELDTNASPTMDTQLRVKVVRVRPIETIGAPVQLVR